MGGAYDDASGDAFGMVLHHGQAEIQEVIDPGIGDLVVHETTSGRRHDKATAFQAAEMIREVALSDT